MKIYRESRSRFRLRRGRKIERESIIFIFQ